MKRQQGFTLIELMITLVVMAVLIAIAYPSYTNQIRQSKRAECAGSLMSLAGAMERYFTQNSTYTGAVIGSVANSIFTNQCPQDGGTKTYDLALTNLTATTYTLTATPSGAQSGDVCGTLSLTQTGVKGDALNDVNQCWR